MKITMKKSVPVVLGTIVLGGILSYTNCSGLKALNTGTHANGGASRDEEVLMAGPPSGVANVNDGGAPSIRVAIGKVQGDSGVSSTTLKGGGRIWLHFEIHNADTIEQKLDYVDCNGQGDPYFPHVFKQANEILTGGNDWFMDGFTHRGCDTTHTLSYRIKDAGGNVVGETSVTVLVSKISANLRLGAISVSPGSLTADKAEIIWDEVTGTDHTRLYVLNRMTGLYQLVADNYYGPGVRGGKANADGWLTDGTEFFLQDAEDGADANGKNYLGGIYSTAAYLKASVPYIFPGGAPSHCTFHPYADRQGDELLTQGISGTTTIFSYKSLDAAYGQTCDRRSVELKCSPGNIVSENGKTVSDYEYNSDCRVIPVPGLSHNWIPKIQSGYAKMHLVYNLQDAKKACQSIGRRVPTESEVYTDHDIVAGYANPYDSNKQSLMHNFGIPAELHWLDDPGCSKAAGATCKFLRPAREHEGDRTEPDTMVQGFPNDGSGVGNSGYGAFVICI